MRGVNRVRGEGRLKWGGADVRSGGRRRGLGGGLVAGRRGKALGLGEDGGLGRRRVQLLALRHELQGGRVRRGWVVGRQGAEGLEGRRRGQVGGHLGEGRGREVGQVLVGLRVPHLGDGCSGRGLDVGHGHGGGEQWLLPGRLAHALGGGLGWGGVGPGLRLAGDAGRWELRLAHGGEALSRVGHVSRGARLQRVRHGGHGAVVLAG